jgi:exosortase/archaeosortase
MGIFDFAHSYAAKVASLFAMFLMAIALFDLLPELHRHVMKVLNPVIHVTRIIAGVLVRGLGLARRLRQFWT